MCELDRSLQIEMVSWLHKLPTKAALKYFPK